jgi:crotonobetainyl-CoA:carnitine CoA-transferase CaiB-like acyl-CoA transferase
MPLHGLRVLDLAGLAGAHCGKLLADMGADVIKVEPPGGDPVRRLGPFFRDEGDPEQSLVFWHYNAGKRSVVLDLLQERGRRRFLELARGADVIVESAAPGTLEALDLGYTRLAEVAPQIVLVSITPFGQSGPYRDWRSSDTVAQAMGGMVYVNGHPDEAPLRGFGLQAYHSASTYAAIAALLALLRREESGHGQHIDVSLQACVAATVEHVSGFFQQTGAVEERRGSLHWSRYFRTGACRDGYVMHCTLGDWTSLVEWLKSEGKAQDLDQPQWQDFDFRKAHCEHVFDVLDAWAKTHTVAELVEGAQLRRVPYAPVLPLAALPADPHLRQRGFFVEVEHEELGARLRYPGAPYRFSATPWRIQRRPPRIGEHDRDVSAETRGSRFQVQVPGPELQLPAPNAESGTQNLEPGTWNRETRTLDGLRIIDFTWVVAGPVATRILCDQGAEVIKIERRDSLDFGSRRGGLTGNLNRGKQSVVLNMAHAEGVALARSLIARADVVIDNFSARVMPNWGLDFDSLRRLNPRLIAVRMSGFGGNGPYRDHVSYGPTLQALAGFSLSMRYPGGAPAGWGFSYSDMAAGYSAALAVLIALWHRRRTGEGQLIDLAQLESLAALIGPSLLAVPMRDASGEAVGNRSPEEGAAPQGIYRCADRAPDSPGARRQDDRWCAIAVFGDEDWQRFAATLGSPGWTGDSRFATATARLAHQAELDRLIESWTRPRAAEEVMETLQRAGIAAGIVADAEDLCLRDPQLRHRGYWVDVATPEGERVRLDGVPFVLGDCPGYVAAAGPLLGEHTEEVLKRVLAMSDERVAELREAGVIGK